MKKYNLLLLFYPPTAKANNRREANKNRKSLYVEKRRKIAVNIKIRELKKNKRAKTKKIIFDKSELMSTK